MRNVLKIVGFIVIGLITLFIVTAGILFYTTAGDYTVLPTVTDDAGLPRLELYGYTYHAETYGDPSSPTVIVLHGGPGGDYRSLLGLKELADYYYVVFFDQRGAGLSERVPKSELTYQGALEDLDAIVDYYGDGQPVHLVGHSWGAMLGSGYLGYAPEKVASAVLAEPGFLNAQEAQKWQETYAKIMSGLDYYSLALKAGFASFHVSEPDEYAREDFLVGQQILPYFENHPDNPYHCPGEPYDAPMWRWGTSANNGIQRTATDAELDSLSSRASEFTKPVLFLASECNTWIGPDLQAKHVTLYPNAELVIISDSGHDMFWDNTGATVAAVRVFLDGTTATANHQ